MRRKTVRVIAAAAFLGFGAIFAQIRPGVELEGAIAKEQVGGDLKAAISAYQRIAANGSAPRDVRAKALLHLAECYEKLGQRESQKVYERIVQDFGDQPSAVQARAKLAALKRTTHPVSAVSMTEHQIDVPLHLLVAPGDTDGHNLVYLDREKAHLIYIDPLSGKKRVIFVGKDGEALNFRPSRDFSKVSLRFALGDKTRLAVVNTDGTGYHELQTANIAVKFWSWSWDGRYLLLGGQSHDGASHLLSLRIENGQIREIETVKGGRVLGAAFSPDGRFIAYNTVPALAGEASHIFVLSTGEGLSRPVYEELPPPELKSTTFLRLLDWTADGRFLVMVSQRTGQGALHLLPVSNGKALGSPIFVRNGDFEDAVTTMSGGLVYSAGKLKNYWVAYATTLDGNSHTSDWTRLAEQRPDGAGYPNPAWSSDSNQVVYIMCDQRSPQPLTSTVHLYDFEAGVDRELSRARGYLRCVWATQRTKLFCSAVTDQETQILSISIQSGAVTLLYTYPHSSFGNHLAYLADDDQTVYLCELEYPGWKLLRWGMNDERWTVSESAGPSGGIPPVTARQEWLVRRDKQTLQVRPRVGGDWRTLVNLTDELNIGAAMSTFSQDGKWLHYRDLDSTGKPSLFRIPTSGGVPERLGGLPVAGVVGGIYISPDAGKIVFTAGDPASSDLWLLENLASRGRRSEISAPK